MRVDDNMLISVIIPVYNGERFVEKAITSATMQPEVSEVIVVNDGSTDNTNLICKKISGEDPKVKYLELTSNEGPSVARNEGMSLAKGKYISFLDADDYFLKGRFGKSIYILESRPEVDGVYSIVKNMGIDKYGPEHTQSNILGIKKNIHPNRLFNYMVEDKNELFSIISLVFRRRILDTMGFFDTRFKYSEDLDYLYRMALKCRLVSDNETDPKIVRVVHGKNLTLNKQYDPATARFPLVEKWYEIMIKEGFDSRSNRFLLRRYLHLLAYNSGKLFPFPLRIWFKLYSFVLQFIKHPILLKRLLNI